MNSFLQYLIQSSACLAALYLVYRCLLRGETFFRLNRFYLIFASLASMLIPLVRPDLYSIKPIHTLIYMLEPVIITPEKIGAVASSHPGHWLETAVFIYFTGLVIFSTRFFSRLFYFIILVMKNDLVKKKDMNLVVMKKECAPFSFLNYIFIDTETGGSDDLNTILRHEKEHIRQFHTADLIFLEAICTVLWFNPFAWFILQSLKREHEYLADEGVILSGIGAEFYSKMLISRTIGKPLFAISHNFNVSLLKTRIMMMSKARSKNRAKLKVFFALPLIFSIFFFFSGGSPTSLSGQSKTQDKPVREKSTQPQVSQSGDENEIFKVAEKMPSYPGGNDELIKFLAGNIKYPEESKTKGVEGTVFVTFIVRQDGSVTDVKIIRGFDRKCDEEALRVVKMMPKWTPGEEKGKKVNVVYNVPIKFKLDKDTEKKTEKK